MKFFVPISYVLYHRKYSPPVHRKLTWGENEWFDYNMELIRCSRQSTIAIPTFTAPFTYVECSPFLLLWYVQGVVAAYVLHVTIITLSTHHAMSLTKPYFVIRHTTQAAIIGTTMPVSPLRVKSLQFSWCSGSRGIYLPLEIFKISNTKLRLKIQHLKSQPPGGR